MATRTAFTSYLTRPRARVTGSGHSDRREQNLRTTSVADTGGGEVLDDLLADLGPHPTIGVDEGGGSVDLVLRIVTQHLIRRVVPLRLVGVEIVGADLELALILEAARAGP